MLLQTILYPDDFPINIRIANIKNVPLHYHVDIELVFVLSGEVNLTNGYGKFTLREGDVFTNNGHEIHSISRADKDNMVAIVQISNTFFAKYFPTLSKSIYRTNGIKISGSKREDLQLMLLNILLKYTIRNLNYKNDCINGTIELIEYLYKHFNLFMIENELPVSASDENAVTIERLSRIISYIYENYQTKITLENIAEIEHLSVFYLSHLIKDYTGMGFRDFLSFARVERSEISLLDTKKSISRIAKEVGFSTTAYYRRFFEKWYGHSPEEHRRVYQPLVMSVVNAEHIEDSSSQEAITGIKSLLYGLNADAEIISETKRDGITLINIDNTKTKKQSSKAPRKITITLTDEDSKIVGEAELEIDKDVTALEISLKQ